MLTTAAPMLIGFLVTVTMMLTLRPVAIQLRLVDVPGGRKTHNGEVPVMGGVAIFIGLLASVLAMGESASAEASMLVAAAVMVLVGAMDDRFDLPPNVRILAHIAAVLTLVIASGYRVGSLGNLLGTGALDLGAFSFMFTVVAAIALINAFNMLDGLDGLAGGVALVALGGLSFVFSLQMDAGPLIVAMSLVGTLAAFLIFNLPARFNRRVLAFMGDAGSTLLGFLLAGLSLLAIQPSSANTLPPAVVLWLLPVPILELFTSTFRRAVTGLSPMKADRGHFHHRLRDAGFSVRAIFILYLGTSSVSALTGLWAWRSGISEPVMFYAFLAFCCVWLALTHNARRIARFLPRSLRRASFAPLRRRSNSTAVGSRR
jgi:UDP-GlcNAc:undecaprenyl-phosphate GlcNAc-1-phosphate transferase